MVFKKTPRFEPSWKVYSVYPLFVKNPCDDDDDGSGDVGDCCTVAYAVAVVEMLSGVIDGAADAAGAGPGAGCSLRRRPPCSPPASVDSCP